MDLEAYEALRRRKRRGQSFSDVIKEHFIGAGTGSTLLRAVREIHVSESTLAEAERIVAERKMSYARSADL